MSTEAKHTGADGFLRDVQHEEWRDAWLSAEAAEAVATLEEALDAADAWQCAPHSAHLDLQPHAGASSAADRG